MVSSASIVESVVALLALRASNKTQLARDPIGRDSFRWVHEGDPLDVAAPVANGFRPAGGHFFNTAIQFTTTVIGVDDDVSGSADVLIKKRSSAATSYGKKL